MFAPKVPEPSTKAATNNYRPGHTIGSEATLRLPAQQASRSVANERGRDDEQEAVSKTSCAVAWDFSKVAMFPKLVVGRVDDPLEREADSIAKNVMRMTDPVISSTDVSQTLRRQCACEDSGSACESCAEAPPIVHDVLSSSGQALDGATRSFFEPRFGADLSNVRIHTGAHAIQSARSVNSLAYTVGRNIVFAQQRYEPSTPGGRRLLAHELAHVMQQEGDSHRALGMNGAVSTLQLQRQDDGTASASDGELQDANPTGFPLPIFPKPPGPGVTAWICGRALNYPGLSTLFGHAYVKAPPDNYAIVAPLCTPTDGGSNSLLFGGTAAHKWDNSCDPGASTPECIDCVPKRGVTDVKQCLRNAFGAYNSPTMHKALGPNSNTFAYTLANACCDGITTSAPFPSLTYPGWGDPPAPARPANCPPGPPDCT